MSRGQVREGDGRTARSARTRAAAAQALLDLVREGDTAPTVAAIAARAGVTARALHLQFGSVGDLHRAAAERATAEVLGLIRAVPPDAPLAERIDAVCRQRAVIHEHLAPLRRAARALEATSPPLAEARAAALRASQEQVERIFAGELAPLTAAARRRRVAAVEAALGDETWARLRDVHHLSVPAARRTMSETASALLTPPPTSDEAS